LNARPLSLGNPARAGEGLMVRTTGRKPHRIDVHHHFFPPEYRARVTEWAQATGVGAAVQKAQVDWTIDRAVEEMDRTALATAVLSTSTPGVWFGDAAEARRLARICNEFAARMANDRPGRFGSFASVPMPDIDGTLAEIAYALDVLKADGIGMTTSFDGVWPGDVSFAPVFEELNRRKAIVYFHPLAPDCCSALMDYVPASVVEVPQDTTRAVVSLLFSGAFARYPDIRFIFSHAGAGVPVLAGRMSNAVTRSAKIEALVGPAGVDATLRKLYFDTANSAYAPTMAALLKLVPLSQVLFGSDYPYLTVLQNLEDLSGAGLTVAQCQAIERRNALALLPHLGVS
jgi:predicted TIM-barrel fold metal-dependent hydrolase